MRQMSGKKRVVMTGISSLLVAGLVVGNIEYADTYVSIRQQSAGNGC